MISSLDNNIFGKNHSNPIHRKKRSFVVKSGSALSLLVKKIYQLVADFFKHLANKLGLYRNDSSCHDSSLDNVVVIENLNEIDSQVGDVRKNCLDEDQNSSLIEDRKSLGLTEAEADIRGYLYRFNFSDVILKDDSPISFVDGVIKPLISTTDDEKRVARETFFYILKASFGPVLSEIVKTRYSLDKIDAVTFGDLKKALIGMAANVREENLRDLFECIKSYKEGDKCLPGMMVGNYILEDKQLLESLREKQAFDDLSSEDVEILVNTFRTLRGEDGLTTNMFEVLYPGQNLKEIKAKLPEFLVLHDINLLDCMKSWEYLSLDYHELAITEFAGKTFAYYELKQGMVFTFPTEDNKPTFYKVHNVLTPKGDGVTGYLITPLNNNQDAYLNSNEENINLVFRGTESNPKGIDSGASLVRDLDPKGVGKTSFEARENDILAMLKNYLIKTTRTAVTLNISGHSLGACDTQRALVAILAKISESDSDSIFRKIKKIKITTHNSPKIDIRTNIRYINSIMKIDKNDIECQIEINHVRYYDNRYEDGIQLAGGVLVGATLNKIENREFVKRRVVDIKFDMDKGLFYGLADRHSIRAFNTRNCQVPWEIEVYDEDHQQLDEKLELKRLWSDGKGGRVVNSKSYARHIGSFSQGAAKSALDFVVQTSRVFKTPDFRRVG